MMFGTRLWKARVAGAVVGALCFGAAAHGQLFVENFQADHSPSWTVNAGPSDVAADFFFNYSTVGIPAAPHGVGTRGMKLQANLTNGIFGGMSVSPAGRTFIGNYTVSFDWWSNIIGPFPTGGNGSTNLSTFGIGTAGTFAQWPGAAGALDCVFFGATGDGGSAADWRAYSPAAPSSYLATSGVYAAGALGSSNNSSDPYYAMFGNVAAPAAQIGLYPQQTGLTPIGAAGMAWHRVQITRTGNTATWKVDGRLIATVDLSAIVLGGSNICFGHSDVNGSSSTDVNRAALLFTLIDNIRVDRQCRADFDGLGGVKVADIFAFLSAWFAGDLRADYNESGTLTVGDIFTFLTVWFAGCA